MKAQGFIIKSLLFHCCVSSCLAAIWKTEEAFIIDDNLDDDTPAVTDVTNCNVRTNGKQGRCVQVHECYPFYNFFSTEKRDSQLEILQGFHEKLNASKAQPCVPDSQDEIPTTNNPVGIEFEKQEVEYVCCTSLKFVKAQSISLDEYLTKNPDEPSEKPPKIPFATVNATTPKIVSGTPASPGEFPFAVAILKNGRQFCGGSLLDSQWVLSAAHCFDQFTSQRVRQLVIKIGDHDISQPGEVQHQDALVSKLFLHTGYFKDTRFRDDIALVKLKTPVTPAGNVRAIELHEGTPNINRGLVETVIAGWGVTCFGSCPTTVLLKTKMQVITNSECSRTYSGTQAPPITQNMVCASGTSNSDACGGDSGGPLFIYQGGAVQQIGIVSWDNLDDDAPAVTDVPNRYNCYVRSSGKRGRCLPVQECYSQLEILQGFQEYLKASKYMECVPDSQDEIPTTDNSVVIEAEKQEVEYVCCPPQQFAKARSISLHEYLSKNPDEPSEKPPQIPFATVNTTERKIVSGTPASPGEFPFAPGEIQHQDALVSKLFLHIGRFTMEEHKRDDIALLKLKTPVSPASNVRAIALHGGTPNIDQGLVEAVVVGWGITCADSCPPSTVLLQTKIQVISNSECSRRYSDTQVPPVTQNMVCASGTSNEDSCTGDSGGPIFIYQSGAVQQIGIVSWGMGCGAYPSVNTRVSKFINWIQKHKNKPNIVHVKNEDVEGILEF
ncbi:unnamed protein product [Orchesella dallaii]|uniref:Peptidase S1 domain-containing protein n=1 Tax=Orchesella dallaii TaxID=48710 RepID=A0ABP1Q9A2_9HEXA